MRVKSKIIKLMADFETSVYPGQTSTEVWAAATVPIGREYTKKDCIVDNSIKAFFKTLKNMVNENNSNLVVYFHNLKFDGSFILDYLIKNHYQQTFYRDYKGDYFRTSNVSSGTFSYNISDMGQWYSITLRYRKYLIEFRDSAKLLPFSVREIAEAFKTKYQKGRIEYIGERHAGGIITDNEKDYICDDVMIVKEALESFFEEGYDGLTIGACCFKEWKTLQGFANKEMFRAMYPDLTQCITPWGESCDTFIRESFKGGWCYVNPIYENVPIESDGLTVDANSMYPSVMHSSSGNRFCYGLPTYFKGMPSTEVRQSEEYYFYIRFTCSFKIKKDMLPTVQIKKDDRYVGNEWLTSSDININGININKQLGPDGNLVPVTVTLTMSETDFNLFMSHYEVSNFKPVGGVYFKTNIGVFDSYIDKYMDKKMTSKGAKRQIAKLFLNNLFGKLSSSRRSNNQVCNTDDLSALHFDIMDGEKEPGYIAVGAQITSYARAKIIGYAQQYKDRFVYADTDSLHMIGSEEPDIIPLHESKLGYWKTETHWNKAIFVRQKTYIEHITYDNNTADYYNVKCCGMTSRLKNIVAQALEHKPIEIEKAIELGYNEYETEFINNGLDISDFTHGFEIDGQLKAKRINGGTILENGKFKIK